MGLGRILRTVIFGGALVVALAACDRGQEVHLITATPVCPVVANAASASGTVTAFDELSVTITTSTNATVVVHYLGRTSFNRLTPLTGDLKAGMRVQVLVQSSSDGVPAALTVIQQPTASSQNTCTASQGGVPGVVGLITSVLDNGQQFTMTDDQGKHYVLAVTATTSLTQLAAAQQSAIAVGERVLVSGTQHGSGIDADQIIITTNAF